MEYVREKFGDMIAMYTSSLLARVITENDLNLFTIDTMKPEISRILGVAINKELMEFGLQIPEGQFYVTDIKTPDEDPNYARLKQQYITKALDTHEAEVKKAIIEANEAANMAELASASACCARRKSSSFVRMAQSLSPSVVRLLSPSTRGNPFRKRERVASCLSRST